MLYPLHFVAEAASGHAHLNVSLLRGGVGKENVLGLIIKL
jgi:hypothetical protein